MPNAPSEPLDLEFYTKRDCPLCDKALAAIERVRARIPGVPIRIVKRDVETDANLLERYGTLIPVIELNGDRLCVYNVSERRLAKTLASAWKAQQARISKDPD